MHAMVAQLPASCHRTIRGLSPASLRILNGCTRLYVSGIGNCFKECMARVSLQLRSLLLKCEKLVRSSCPVAGQTASGARACSIKRLAISVQNINTYCGTWSHQAVQNELTLHRNIYTCTAVSHQHGHSRNIAGRVIIIVALARREICVIPALMASAFQLFISDMRLTTALRCDFNCPAMHVDTR